MYIYNTGGQRLNPAFVSDIEKKLLSRTGEMKTDQTLNEGLARLGRSGFHLLRGRNFLHWFWQGKFSIKNQRLWRALIYNYLYQGWAKLAPWVKLAPALQKATVEIFAWTFFLLCRVSLGEARQGECTQNFCQGWPMGSSQKSSCSSLIRPCKSFWPESFFILKGFAWIYRRRLSKLETRSGTAQGA